MIKLFFMNIIYGWKTVLIHIPDILALKIKMFTSDQAIRDYLCD